VPVFSLLYVSRALVHGSEAVSTVADIVKLARERNGQLGVTGALLFTGDRFAQVLEGTRGAVKELMVSINRDPRHTDVTVIREGTVAEARFAQWTLAYSGPSAIIERMVAAALDEASVSGRQRGDRLLQLLKELTCGYPDRRWSEEWRGGGGSLKLGHAGGQRHADAACRAANAQISIISAR